REPVGCQAGEQLEQLRARLRGEASERQLLDLALEALDVVGMAVPHAADADAGDEVDVLVAVHVDERAALAPGHGQPGVERERLQAVSVVSMLAIDALARV